MWDLGSIDVIVTESGAPMEGRGLEVVVAPMGDKQEATAAG